MHGSEAPIGRSPSRLAEPRLDQATLDAVILDALGGEVATFVRGYWAKRSLYRPGACAPCAQAYGVDNYIADIAAAYPAPFAAISVREGERVYSLQPTTAALREAIAGGAVSSMKISRKWHQPGAPNDWRWQRALFGALTRALGMVYLGPERTEDVDLFFAGPRSALGRHYDTTHVFTMQLVGERRWVVDREARYDDVMACTRAPGWTPAVEIPFMTDTEEFVLKPGDALYVPAYAVHEVSGVTWSVSLSLGLRAFNEMDVLSHLLDVAQLTRYTSYPPLASAPGATPQENAAALQEMLARCRRLLRQLDIAAQSMSRAGLRLPATLAPLDEAVAAQERAGVGFARLEPVAP